MNQKNVYCISILWHDDAPKRVLNGDEKNCLEQAVNTIFEQGIERYCEENPVYTALFEKAGLIQNEWEKTPDEADIPESPHLIPLPDTLTEQAA